MKQIIISALITAAVAAPLAAQAEGAYIGGNVGRAEQKFDIEGFNFKEHKTGFKLYGGYDFTQNVGIEGGYVDFRAAERSGNGGTASSKPRSLYVAATGTLPLNEQFALFGKAGLATTHTKVAVSVPGFSESDSRNHTSPMLGLGASFALNKNVSFVAEYENFGKVAKDDGSSIKASLVSVGVRYKF
jgi:OOP family OmpA-OmpF porin